jgi:signal recognition particle subunit SRP54
LQKAMPTGLSKGFTPPGGMPGMGGPKLPGLGGPKLPGLGGPSLPGLPKGPFDPSKR